MREITVSYSELQTYRHCPLRWQWAYKERWSKPPEAMSNLDKGTAFHAVAEAHYRSLMDTQVDQRAQVETLRLEWAARRVEAVLADMSPEMADLIRGMYQRYVAQWGMDREWQILGVEEQGSFMLGTIRMQVNEGQNGGLVIPEYEDVQVRLKWKADVIVYDRRLGGNMVVDHKTCSSLQQDKSLRWDDQLPIYDMGYRLAHPGVSILGGMHNEVRKPTGKSDPAKSKVPWGRRTRGTYTLSGMKEIADNALDTVQAMYAGRMFSNPGIKATDCGYCAFEDVHSMQRQGVPAHDTLKAQGFRQDFTRH